MRSGHRRSAMRVRDGRVQKKNNWALDRGDYKAWTQAEIRIDRKDPGYASRHLITVAQLREFLDLLPDWDQMTIGLDAIVLDTEQDAMGWCSPGVVAVCAWEADLWWDEAYPSWVDDHHASSTPSMLLTNGAMKVRTRCAGPRTRHEPSNCCTSCPTSSVTTTTA